ncbi:MAG: peptidoglycan-binding protein, partial [bacterium]|nr:peptidoglycan-binding protein [bacterium]
YPEAVTTGYYGSLTVRAVQRFQCKHLNLCQGTPDTNGYGLAGPKTRQKMNEILGTRTTTTAGGAFANQTTPTDQTGQTRAALISKIKETIKQLQQQLLTLLTQLAAMLQAKVEGR